MKIYKNMTELIGKTPIMQLTGYEKINNLNAKIFAKLEFFNPAGSVKDRVALNMINAAKDKITHDTVIIEPTSGNTGIGLAAVAKSMGLRVILTMPDTMSVERRRLLKAYGAELVLTDGKLGMKGAIAKAEELAASISNSIILSQFTNPANPATHYNSTAPEIWEDTEGQFDIFVAGVGTGGTITGIGKYLKEKNSSIKIVAVEPASSPVLSGGSPAPHKIQGIGAGFIPDILDTSVYDEIICVGNEDAILTKEAIAKTDGILVGISAGAAVYACKELAMRAENIGKTIVTILPDTGERYS